MSVSTALVLLATAIHPEVAGSPASLLTLRAVTMESDDPLLLAAPAEAAPNDDGADPAADDDSAQKSGTVSVEFFVALSGSRWRIGGHWTRSEPFFVQVPLGQLASMQVQIVMPPQKPNGEKKS